MTLSHAVIDAIVASGCTIEQLAAIVKADIAPTAPSMSGALPVSVVALKVGDPDKNARVSAAPVTGRTRQHAVVEMAPPEHAKFVALKAISHAPLNGSQKKVAAQLVEHFNVNTRRCDPGTKMLAHATGLDERAVRRAVAGLKSAGMFAIERHGGRSRTNRYVPNWSLFVDINTRVKVTADPGKTVHQNLGSKPRSDIPVRGTSNRTLRPDPRQPQFLLPITSRAARVLPRSADAALEAAKGRVSRDVTQHLVGFGKAHFAAIYPTIPNSAWEAAYCVERDRAGSGLGTIVQYLQGVGPPVARTG